MLKLWYLLLSNISDVEIDVNAMNVEKRAEATRICEQYGRLETGFLGVLLQASC